MSDRPSVRRLPARLLVVTDRHQAGRPLPEVIEDVLAAGTRWIWLRDKDLPADARRALARDIAAQVARYSGLLTVGADVALAAACGGGVQLGTRDDVATARRVLGPAALIGVSGHSCDDIRVASEAGADYATLSPVFASSSKPGYGPALGLDALRAAAAIGLPVLALGGVTPGTTQACLEAGAAGIAVMGEAMRPGGLRALAGFRRCVESTP